MSADALLTHAARARVGEVVTYTSPDPIGPAGLRAYAAALGVRRPPPTLVCESCQFVDRPRDAHGYAGHDWCLELAEPVTSVRLGNRYHFGIEPAAETVVTTTWRLSDLQEGPVGVRATSMVDYRDQTGTLLATNEETMLYRRRDGAPLEARRRPPTLTAPVLRWRRALTLTDLVAYAGATWDHHRLHYDAAYARSAGFAGPVVDGQMWGALFAAQAQLLAGSEQPARRLASLDVRYLSPLVVPDDVDLVAARPDEESAPGAARHEATASDGRLVAAATSHLGASAHSGE